MLFCSFLNTFTKIILKFLLINFWILIPLVPVTGSLLYHFDGVVFPCCSMIPIWHDPKKCWLRGTALIMVCSLASPVGVLELVQRLLGTLAQPLGTETRDQGRELWWLELVV